MIKHLKPYTLFLYLVILVSVILFLKIGHNWQVSPAYLAALISILVLVLRKVIKRKALFGISLLLLIGFSAASIYVFPLLKLPEPAGKYIVGVLYSVLDTQRDEILTPETGDKRKLYLKIWYPAKSKTVRVKYIEGGNKTIEYLINRSNISLPAFFFSHLGSAQTNSHVNASIADGPFPIVTFSHGHGMWQSQNTSLMEQLASQGMVVVSIAHSHQTIFAAGDDHTIVKFEKIVPLNMNADSIKIKKYLRRIEIAKSKHEMDSLITDDLTNIEFQNEFLEIWRADISNAVDMMISENESSESIFFNRLDTNKIGAAGMSFGGASAVEASLRELRIKVAVNLDGKQFGNFIKLKTDANILFLEAKQFDHSFSRFGPFIDKSSNKISCIMFNDTKHLNFSDIGLISPVLAYMGILGKVDGKFVVEQMNKIVPDFFNAGFNELSFRADQYLISDKVILPADESTMGR